MGGKDKQRRPSFNQHLKTQKGKLQEKWSLLYLCDHFVLTRYPFITTNLDSFIMFKTEKLTDWRSGKWRKHVESEVKKSWSLTNMSDCWLFLFTWENETEGWDNRRRDEMIAAEMCKKTTTLSCFGEIFNLSIIKIISVFLTLSHLEQSAEGQMISDVKKKTNFIVIRETCGAFYSSVTLRAPQKLIGQIDSKQVIDYEGLKGMFDAAMTHNHSVTRDSVLQNTYFLICMCFMGSTGVFFFFFLR